MPAFFINDPAHWRQRAEEARTIAEQMSDLQSKDSMLRIAKDSERLAENEAGPERPRSIRSGRPE